MSNYFFRKLNRKRNLENFSRKRKYLIFSKRLSLKTLLEIKKIKKQGDILCFNLLFILFFSFLNHTNNNNESIYYVLGNFYLPRITTE